MDYFWHRIESVVSIKKRRKANKQKQQKENKKAGLSQNVSFLYVLIFSHFLGNYCAVQKITGNLWKGPAPQHHPRTSTVRVCIKGMHHHKYRVFRRVYF